MTANLTSRDFLVQRLEALDKDREQLHEDIRKAGFDPLDLETEVLQRRRFTAQEYDL
jgi:hypothetical protein